MGDRYTLYPQCPHCGHIEEEMYYYAPTSGFLTHECESCKVIIDLEELSGIDAESTSSTEYGIKAIREMKNKETERTEESDGELLNRLGMDGQKWAKEFMKLFRKRKDEINEGLMISWFCNAIMAGFDEANRRNKNRGEKNE